MSEPRPPRVLVVDDETTVRGLLCDLLTVWGYEAHAAASGGDALALFARGDWDLVLTDLTMPGLTGLQVVEALRRADPAVGVIMLTASGADLEVQRQRLGFTLLRKPLELSRLQAAVRRVLDAATTGGRSPSPAP